jgi:hypothetical protein
MVGRDQLTFTERAIRADVGFDALDKLTWLMGDLGPDRGGLATE